MDCAMHTKLGDVENFTPCDGCKQPESCGGRWPDDDKHMPGRLRGCFAKKTQGVTITYDRPIINREKVMAKDNDAYRRLVKNGVQPPKVDGSAALESRL